MGQRQSSQQPNNPQDNTADNNSSSSNISQTQNTPESNRRDRVLRPRPRRSATSNTVPYRLRRERSPDGIASTPDTLFTSQTSSRGDQPITDALETTAATLPPSSTMTTPSHENMSPFSRMIAQVISEAVVASFRNGHIPILPTANRNENEQENNVRQHLTMHLSPDIFQQIEPESTENSFMQFMRLPVIVTSVSRPAESTAVNADGQPPTTTGETELTRVMMLPVFLYGLRTSTTQSASSDTAAEEEAGSDTQPRRQSARIRERLEREQQQQQQPVRGLGSGQWTVYIISGNGIEGMMNDSPSYEDLLDLATFIGPARLPTVSQEAIDNHVPIVKYTQQVKQAMLGNADGCQVCLSNYQSEEDVRILDCHHGFHKECIDKWLTEGQNKCPLCRHQPVPTTHSTTPNAS
ncbi:putative RING finger protein C4G3.12c [Choanephora cucurbitarum]|uniref:RING-type E3 ubiquitin transferase n=1 Tax=Choanephora cucurbitarum TaxID=101091 RepID=A0A1C7NKX1_9FUNG|nr:putative RING finger protein C4G3.12c [Choanephora cucurbitarum]